MPVHPFAPARGTLELVDIDSEALRGNLVGDPSRRRVAVYLPEGYAASDADYPLLVDLVGFTGSGLKHTGWSAFEESVPQRIDRLIAEGKMGPVIAAFPDCFTSLGGNQYIDSAALGGWGRFLTQEMLPRLEQRFRLRRGREHRAAFGKSSGGYGAIVHGMRHAGSWGAVACHSGDMAFEWVYLPMFPRLLDAIAAHGKTPAAYLDHLRGLRKLSKDDSEALMTLAMAATYDPDPAAPSGIRLPVDLETCEVIEPRWQAWLEHDPVRLIERPEVQASLRSLKGLYIDCGWKDQYSLHYGSRRLVRRLVELGIAHRYEEFDDNHSQIDYRMDESLPFLWRALAG